MREFYGLRLKIDEKELEEIFTRLKQAQEEIYDCYAKLRLLGVIEMEKSPCSEEQGENVTQK